MNCGIHINLASLGTVFTATILLILLQAAKSNPWNQKKNHNSQNPQLSLMTQSKVDQHVPSHRVTACLTLYNIIIYLKHLSTCGKQKWLWLLRWKYVLLVQETGEYERVMIIYYQYVIGNEIKIYRTYGVDQLL